MVDWPVMFTTKTAMALMAFLAIGAASSPAGEKKTTAEKLLEAVKAGDTAAVQKLLKERVDVNAVVNGGTPLWTASQAGRAAMVRLLLASGAKVSIGDRNGAEPLLIASQEGHADVVQILLDAGANVNAVAVQGATALAQAAQGGKIDAMKLLLKAGAKVDAPESTGATPLYLASQQGQAEAVKLLLAAGASVDVSDVEGATPLHLATQNCHVEAIALLIAAHANVDRTAKNGFTPLDAASLPDPPRVQIGFQMTDHGAEPIYNDNSRDHAGAVRLLLAAGANPNTVAPAVHNATPLLMSSENGHAESVRLLLRAGAKVEAASEDGYTSLILASANGHTDIVRQLLAAGAKVNAATRDGTTAMLVATREGHSDIVQLLAGAGEKTAGTATGAATAPSTGTAVGAVAGVARTEALQAAYNAGLAALQSQDFKTAADRFQAAADIDPRQVAVWTQMAAAYTKLSETSTGADARTALVKALDASAKAEALGPDAGIANNRALLLARLGRLSEAQAEFAKAARIDPAKAGQYLFNSGAVLMNVRQPGEALLSFQKAVAADPSFADAWYFIGTILCGGMTVDEEGNPKAPSGLAEAFRKYMALRPQGKYAAAARDLLAAAGSQVQTTYRSDPNFIPPEDRVAATRPPISVGGNIQQAALVYQQRPVYPRLAKLARVQGAVCLTAIIGRDGIIPYLKLVSGNPLLVPAAFEAVRQWRYRPTLLNGEPVEVITRIDVNFTLNGGD